MKMRNILSLISIAFLGAMLAGGCKTTPQPNVPEAMAYIQKTYPGTNVVKMDDGSLLVTWESGAEDLFNQLKAKVKEDFGVDLPPPIIE